MKNTHAWRALWCGASACLLAACGRPAPDAVVQSCLQELARHRHERALAYCGPALHAFYSNHLWLAQMHRQMIEPTRFTVDPPDELTSSSAQVRVQLEFVPHDGQRPLRVPLRAALAWRDKWYIDTVWSLGPDGATQKDISQSMPEPMWSW